eukprot:5629144-Pleurochrysis_carterae.AAC.1
MEVQYSDRGDRRLQLALGRVPNINKLAGAAGHAWSHFFWLYTTLLISLVVPASWFVFGLKQVGPRVRGVPAVAVMEACCKLVYQRKTYHTVTDSLSTVVEVF